MSFRISCGPSTADAVRRTWWTSVVIVNDYGYKYEERSRVENEGAAILVASLTENGYHAPALDFDFAVESCPIGNGFSRLAFPGLVVRDRPWRKLLACLDRFGCLRPGFVHDETAWVDPEKTASVLELAVPIDVVPSSTPGHHHVYLDIEMKWRDYRRLCKRMQKAGLLEREFVKASFRRRMTMLFKPGLTKRQLIDDGIMLEVCDRSIASENQEHDAFAGVTGY